MAMNAYVKKLLKAMFPKRYDLIKDRLIEKKRLEERRREYEECDLPERPCHARELFIRSDGGVYPCCLVWQRKHMRIGHIGDPDIMEKIARFQEYCCCDRSKLRPMHSSESLDYELLYIELSLVCQGKCALCCVNAPDCREKYDYYPLLTKLINTLKPERIFVQGGEVLIQKESLEWIDGIRKLHPDIPIWLGTNGSVGIKMVPEVERLFARVYISFMAFNADSYSVITGMDLEMTKRFAEEVGRRKRVSLVLKYVITPSSIHEAATFIEWAISICPDFILVAESGITDYIRWETSDHYWEKIVDRSAAAVRNVLLRTAASAQKSGTKIEFYSRAATMLGIDAEVLSANTSLSLLTPPHR
jgi:pyruvate-formate lyase-activating enzyme